MDKYKGMMLEELQAELKRIEYYCKMWENTTDGSHGMALDMAGYGKVKALIEEMTNEQT